MEFYKSVNIEHLIETILWHEGILERESSSETASVSSVEEIMKEKDIWRKGLQVFQQLGLDKTALAADNKCGLCSFAHKTKFQYG